MLRDPAEHLLRCLHDDAVLADEVSRAKHRESVFGERRQHVRTVRSVAQWRNRPRSRLAWLILFIAIALIAFTARLAAAQPATNRDAPARDDLPTSDDLDASDDLVASAHPSPGEVGEPEDFDPGWHDEFAADSREAAQHHAPTRLGRVDLTITWRRTVRVADPRAVAADGAVHAIASPLDPVTTARGVLWLLLTWRR